MQLIRQSRLADLPDPVNLFLSAVQQTATVVTKRSTKSLIKQPIRQFVLKQFRSGNKTGFNNGKILLLQQLYY